MTRSRFAIFSSIGLFALAVTAQAQTITESSTNTIVPGNSIACNQTGTNITDENSYYRAFDLSTFGISGTWDITSAMFGVESATAGSGNSSQNVTLNLYDNYSTTSTGLTITGSLIGTANVTVNNGTVFLQNQSISAVDTTGFLVMEVLVPDSTASGNNLGNQFFIGSNTDAETGPDYIRAPNCGITTPTTISSVGFPDMHMVMSVTGAPVPEPASVAALGLGALALLRRRRK